jgi:transposase
MRAAKPTSPEQKQELYFALKNARTKGQHQAVLCLWLRAALRLTARQIALALGMSVSGVEKIQARYHREGAAMFKRPGKGGRHHQHMSQEAEHDFLAQLLNETQPANAVMGAQFIQEAYEKRLGHPVSVSVVYRMLKRHNWRPVKLGNILTPQGWAAARVPPEEPHPEREEFDEALRKWTAR